jgi:type I restriction enzyme, S subunit
MVERNLSNLPKGWACAKIGEVYNILGGGTPSTVINQYWEGDIPWITSADIHGLKDIRPKKFITQDAIKNSATTLVPQDSLIVVTRVSLGKVAKTASPICFSQDSQALIGDNSIIFPDYALYYLSQVVQVFKYQHRGTTIAGVPKKQLAELKILIPPIGEQHRIVAKIEELFSDLEAGAAALKKAKAQLKLYRRAVLKAAFEGRLTAAWRGSHKSELEPAFVILEKIREERENASQASHKEFPPVDVSTLHRLPEEWEWVSLGELISSMQNGIYKPREFYSSDGVACLRMYNIENGEIIWKDIKRMTLSEEEITKYELKVNDILINRVNSRELVGKAAVITANLERCIYESKNIRMRLINNYAESKYINYWLRLFGQGYFDMNAQQVVGMASINQQQISAMPVPFTHLYEQHHIVEQVEFGFSILDAMEKGIDKGILQAERLRQAILKKAFTGRLVPQDPEDEPAAALLERLKKEKAGNPAGRRGYAGIKKTGKLW